MRKFLLSASTIALMTPAAFAADLSSGTVDYTAPAYEAARQAWGARFGVAFDGYYVTDAPGVEDDWNLGGNVDIAVGGEANGFGAQFDILGSLYSTPDDDNDWTESTLTGAAHLYMRPGEALYGLFGGGGVSDAEDSDEDQTFWFVGLETLFSGPGNTLIFAQGGYLDSDDEYEEGLNEAGFGRIGLRAFAGSNTAFMAAVSGAFGQQDGDDASLANLELEVEQGFGSFSLFASYEGTAVWTDDGDTTSGFNAVMAGLRWRPGATDLESAYRAPGSLDLPSVDRWFAYTANEIE